MEKDAFPIFFSVSSINLDFAERVWEKLPDDWVYLYSKTGEETAHMWDEIGERELPKAKVCVIFWSKDFITSSGCIREIKQAAELFKKGMLRPLVLRLDDYPLKWEDKFSEGTKDIFAALDSALDYRTSHENVNVDYAVDLITRVSDAVVSTTHPRLPRSEILHSMRAVLQTPESRYKFYPVLWVSGFNSTGREHIVREYNRDFSPNGRGFLIEINEATLPMQLLLRIKSEALGASDQTLEEIRLNNEKDSDIEVLGKEISNAVEEVFNLGNYIILRHSRIIDERVELPEWINIVINNLISSTRTKLYIVSQIPLSPQRRVACRDKMVAQRIYSLEENILKSYSYQLIGHFDGHPERWPDEVIDQVVAAAGGTIGFLISLIRASAFLDDFDHLDGLISAEGSSMTQQITTYSRWAFSQLYDYPDEQRTLTFLNDVSPCDIADLKNIVKPTRSILRVVGKLLDLGLIEREADNLYRITPLLSNRLSRDVIRPDLIEWQRRALVEFVRNPPSIEGLDHVFLRIESRIQAALLSGEEETPSNVSNFVSAAHWFQAGVRLYHAKRRDAAYKVLKKAFNSKDDFSHATKIEVIRYFCLSAIQSRNHKDASDCIKILDGEDRTKSMAAFLRANLCEFQHDYPNAIIWYEKALLLNRDKNSRLEHTYRPLISCILRTSSPNFEKAEHYAKLYVELRRSIFSLLSQARVYLHWMHREAALDRRKAASIEALYKQAFRNLANDPGVGSEHFELRAEQAEFEKDFSSALDYFDKAVQASPRPLLKNDRWKLIAKNGATGDCERALQEMTDAKMDPSFSNNWSFLRPILSETYARLLISCKKPLAKLNQFAVGMTDEEISSIIRSSRRGSR